MPRGDPTSVVRLRRSLLEQVDEVAGQAGRIAWIETVCADALAAGNKAPRAARRKTGPVGPSGECKHRNRRVLAYMTICADCGMRLS